MPYNLRKRTRPEPAPVIETVTKKRRVAEPKKRPAETKKLPAELTKSPVGTKKPKVETKKPPTGSKKPPADTKKPPADTKKPPADTKKPPAETKEPPAETKKPPAETKKPPAETEKPSVETKKPKVEIKKQPTETTEQLASDEEVSTIQMAFGVDSCGELGLGKIGISRKLPTEVQIGTPVKQVACGPMHTLSLTIKGEVYSYGCNDEGALGRVTDGDETLEATPTIVPIKDKVIKITAGDSHSVALTEKSEVYIWGNFRDDHGSVGLLPESNSEATYAPIEALPGVSFKDIASGSNHVLLLDVDGSVYSFGVGAQGQLGRLKPDEIVEGDNPRSITAENRELFLRPKKVNLKDVDPQRPFVCDAIYAGNLSSFATNSDLKKNRLAGWGLNNYYQLGYKGQKGQLIQHYPRRSTFTCSTRIEQVACGQHHTLFLTKNGRVYAAGRHEYGMLGLEKVDKEVCPAKFIEAFGSSKVKGISAGINTSFAITEEGHLYAWGMGDINLGLQGDTDLIVPTQVKSLEKKKVIAVSAGGSFTSVLVN